MKIIFFILVMIVAQSAISAPPSDESVEILFDKNKEIFKELKDQIYLDLSGKEKLRIDEGSNSNIEGLSSKKLANYIARLKKISSQRVTAYRSSSDNVETSFLIYRNGFVFSGCITEIVHFKKGKPFKRDWAKPYNLIDLKEGWFAHTLCN